MNKKEHPPGIVGTITDLAIAIGVHRRTCQDWSCRPNFPRRPNGTFSIVAVERWRKGYSFMDDDNQGALIDDLDHRAEHLLKALKDMQPGLIQSLPEDQQGPFAELLEQTISAAIQDAYDGNSAFLFEDYYQNYEGEQVK